MSRIAIPDFALVVLIGPTGAGKSSFAARHFQPTEIVSSDQCRALVSDDETDQDATADAFDLLRHTAGLRLRRRRLTVIDATSIRRPDRAGLVALAREHHALPVAIALDVDPEVCHARNRQRANRDFGPNVARGHAREMRRGLNKLRQEGFRAVHILRGPEAIDAAEVVREPLWTDRRGDHGPFDIIGDVHGCFDELAELLADLGYVIDPYEPDSEVPIGARHPEGRTAFFVGDLTDRGPRNRDCLRLAMGMVGEGSGRVVLGNHDFKLSRWLAGKNVKLNHGLDRTVAELEACREGFRGAVREFISGMLSHQWLADGKLVVAHAGLKEAMHGRGSGAVRSFAMFGDTTGETDEFGLPVRLEWARDYRGAADVVYGHTPTPEAEWLNNTICIDTGCVFGGKLTALRWPERTTHAVPARQQYAEPARPLESSATGDSSAQQDHDRLLYYDDFANKLRIETRFGSTLQVPEENALAALETVSRFGVDPRWLIYAPPTMAAPPTATEGPYLEHPEPAMAHFLKAGVTQLIAEEKHMGSRALAVIARDPEAARARFGVEDGRAGCIYTRTGRPFFSDRKLEADLVTRLGTAIGAAGLWQELQTDWLLLDTEVMPWSAKAGALLDSQYRPTAAAAAESAKALAGAIASAPQQAGFDDLGARTVQQVANAERMARFIAAYSWDVTGIDDYRIAPFHLLAAEGAVFEDRPHDWHMGMAERLAGTGDPILQATRWRVFDATSESERADIVDWWVAHTEAGGEGLVLKPAAFIAWQGRRMVQPAMKVRGRDYLRLVYGPDYDLPDNLERLRKRGLSRKFSLAEREFKLGLEGLHRFVDRRPLADIHTAALAVLALESEPVDPRL